MMEKNSRIYVAGYQGLVGSSLFERLQTLGYSPFGLSHDELDLIDQRDVDHFFKEERPEYVFMAAGKVGGIKANMNQSADFLYENAMIALNVLESAATYKVRKVAYLGSSCIYPGESPQPISETELLKGPLEPSNEAYSVAKILGVKLCEHYRKQYLKNFISIMPCNLYGWKDNFDREHSHVIPGMIRRFHDAKMNGSKTIMLWGSGSSRREFLHADTAADGIIYAMEHYNESSPINLGSGKDISLNELAEMIKEVVGYKGDILFDLYSPVGVNQKLLNVEKIKALGWKYKEIDLKEGIRQVYRSNRSLF